MSIDNALASVAVKDLKAAVAWYEQLFERPADSTPMPEVAEWKFPRGGWLQVYQLPERAGHGSFTLAVSDIEEVVAHAQKLGIDTSNTTSGAMVKTLMIVDRGLFFRSVIGADSRENDRVTKRKALAARSA